MTLVPLDIQPDDRSIPENVQRLIDEGNARIEQFISSRLDDPVPGFYGGDFPLIYSALRTIVEVQLPAGRLFCEWGSGLGVVACLASLLGFEACGIEIEVDLVAAARKLAADLDIPVEFACGSFIPDGADPVIDRFGEMQWLTTGATSGYGPLGLEPDDFSVIFAYPWPGEQQAVEELFDHSAAAGAVLVTFHGSGDLRVQRKKSARRSKR